VLTRVGANILREGAQGEWDLAATCAGEAIALLLHAFAMDWHRCFHCLLRLSTARSATSDPLLPPGLVCDQTTEVQLGLQAMSMHQVTCKAKYHQKGSSPDTLHLVKLSRVRSAVQQ
jgi:hypothetical protein